MKYSAFMIDIVNSRKLSKENREEVQYYIKECIETLNRVFKPSLAFEVVFSAGDEVQGLFNNPVAAFMYYRLLKLMLSPIEIRCGIGVGEWDVKIINGTSTEQDGSVYHNAREAINLAHQGSGNNILFNSHSETDVYLNTLLNTSYLLMSKQSFYQSQIQLLVELMYPFLEQSSMDMERVKDLFTLLKERENKAFYLKVSKNKGCIFQNISSTFIDSEPINIVAESIYQDSMLIESSVRKGISTKISNITNTTRQNIDKVIKSGNISAIRNIDLTSIVYIERNHMR